MSVESAKRLYRERVVGGLCTRCGGVPEFGLRRCDKCSSRMAAMRVALKCSNFLAVCDHYGGRFCAHCGEVNLAFLTIDHIVGDGVLHSSLLTAWLKKVGYPAGYQVLCWNDNLGKARNRDVLVSTGSLYVCECTHWRGLCLHGLTYNQRYNRRRFRRAVSAYGGPECVCCGETNLFFLTLDHGNDDGAAHRAVVDADHIAAWAFKNDYPQDMGIRVMCANSGREFSGGVCPHRCGCNFGGLGCHLGGV